MEDQCTRIQLLPLEVQGQIRSSIAITNLEDVVLELLKNALDAEANYIEIQVYFSKGYCSVSDNGSGIPAEDFGPEGCLGQMHCTSKHLSSLQTYGKYGRFIPCLSNLSLLSIVSRQKAAQFESNLTVYRGRIISRVPEVASQECTLETHGTRVIVRDLFGNIPVRLKHRATLFDTRADSVKEFDSLKKRIVAILLAFSQSINLKICDLHSKHTYTNRTSTQEPNLGAGKQKAPKFNLENIHRTLVQAGYIANHARESWKLASAQTTAISIRASISLIPVASRNRQFISLGNKPLDPVRSGIFFDEVNRFFSLSTFGGLEEEQLGVRQQEDLRGYVTTNQHTLQDLRVVGKGVDRWPMFYIRIDSRPTSTQEIQLEDESESNGLLHSILELLRSLVQEFLVSHGFGMKLRRLRHEKEASLAKTRSEPDLHTHKSSPADVQARPLTSRSMTTRPKPLGRNSQSRTLGGPYTNWPRMKSTDPTATADLLSGLPRSKGEVLTDFEEDVDPLGNDSKIEIGKSALKEVRQKQPSEADFQLLLHNLDDSLSDSAEDWPPCKQSTGTDLREDRVSTGQTSDQIQGPTTILWTDSRTGRLVKIDARTGLILPDALHHRSTRPSPVKRRKKATIPLLSGKSLSKGNLENRVNRLLHNSERLVFRAKEESIKSTICGLDQLIGPDVNAGRHGRHCLMTSSALNAETPSVEHRFAKSSLQKATVLAQVDQKFILCRLETVNANEYLSDVHDECELLVLIDQHAADERVKVEQLYRQFCAASAVSLQKPIIFQILANEAAMFASRRAFFQRWNIVFEIKNSSLHKTARVLSPEVEQHVAVMALPPLIAERCRLEPKIIIDLLRREVLSEELPNAMKDKVAETRSVENDNRDWTSSLAGCPSSLVDVMNSRACRSAIMFNDVLSIEECRNLVRKLSSCVLPFQCAHGRPSMVVVTGLASSGGSVSSSEEVSGGQSPDFGFAKAWKDWQAREVTET